MLPTSKKRFALSSQPALVVTRLFFHEHAEAVLNAAALLSGPKAHRRCLRLLAGLSETASLSVSLRHELVWLHRVLSLDFVGDPKSEETARFGCIDFSDADVEEICCLTDRLHELLLEILELDGDCVVISEELFELPAA